jgi:hypothetical protein
MTGNSNQLTWSQLVMPIESLPPSARDYLAAFDLAAVAISPTGRVFTSRNPVGASAAFWCRAGEADKVPTPHGTAATLPRLLADYTSR